MNRYQFEQIVRTMKREHGEDLPLGDERYTQFYFIMEENVLKTRRKNPNAGDRTFKEAIYMALHMINGRITGIMPDLSAFETPENVALRTALLMAFDPFTNVEVEAAVEHAELGALDDRNFLKKLYHMPIACVLRLLKSVEIWGEILGHDGYFNYIENSIGKFVKNDDKMYFFIGVRTTG